MNIKLLARVKGHEEEWHAKVIVSGHIAQLNITRGDAEPVTVEIIAEPVDQSDPEARWL